MAGEPHEGLRRSTNPFATGAPETLADEELQDRIAIYRALLARLDPEGASILNARADVAAALQELEREAERRAGA